MNTQSSIRKLLDYQGIDPQDIPNIDVYMDQLLSFFEDSLAEFKRNDKEKLLTKTMVNNYVKAGIIERPDKKKYTPEQIKMLIAIHQLKHILSIQDIEIFYEAIRKTGLISFYPDFLKNERAAYQELSETYSTILESELDSQTIIQAILSLCVEASARKHLAELLLDELSQKM